MKLKLDKISLTKKALTFIVYFILICISFVYLEPIFQMISKAFMSSADVVDPEVEWIAKNFSIENITTAAGVLDLGPTLLNTIFFSGALAICQTVVSGLTGYALSRYDFKFKKFWLAMIIMSFVIPTTVLMVPRLMMFVTAQEALGFVFIGTPYPQLAMALLGQGVYSTVLILIFYNFFNLIPRVLDEAAMIDGANSFKIFVNVAVKMSLSTILIVFLFSFVWNWNETFVTGTLVRGSIELLPSKLALFDSEFASSVSASGEAFKINEAYKMSATLISILPLIILYGFVQKQFIQGIENTGITGE